jgi:hypothetical protein
VAETFDMGEPKDGAILGSELLENGGHVQGQIEILVVLFGRIVELPIFAFALFFAPVVAKKVGRRLIQVRLSRPIFHNQGVDHAQISFSQNFVSDGGIATQAAEIPMKNAPGLQIENLKIRLADPFVSDSVIAGCRIAESASTILIFHLLRHFLRQPIRDCR